MTSLWVHPLCDCSWPWWAAVVTAYVYNPLEGVGPKRWRERGTPDFVEPPLPLCCPTRLFTWHVCEVLAVLWPCPGPGGPLVTEPSPCPFAMTSLPGLRNWKSHCIKCGNPLAFVYLLVIFFIVLVE